MPFENEEPPFVEPDPELDALAYAVIGAAIEVHRRLGGPGLDEALYGSALQLEFQSRGIVFQAQVEIEVAYKGQLIGSRRIDFLVGGRLIVEIKAIEKLAPVHKAQVLTYLRIMNRKLGLLINFNEIVLKDGIKRILNPSGN